MERGKLIQDAFTVGFDEQKAVTKTSITNMVERALINMVAQRRLDNIMEHKLDEVGKSTLSIDAFTGRFVGSTAFTSPMVQFVRNQFDESLEVLFLTALGQQLIQPGVVPISPP